MECWEFVYSKFEAFAQNNVVKIIVFIYSKKF